MESKLNKAKRLFRVLNDQRPLGVFTAMPDGKLYHAGKEITPQEQTELTRQFEKTITIKIKTI